VAGTLSFAASGPTNRKTDPKSAKTTSAKSSSAKTHSSAKTSSTRNGKTSSRHAKKSRKTANWRHKGQQKIDSDRTRQIQEALIRENYLQGEPSGVLDQQTEAALKRYQAANGWQSKTVPDSRALIKMGLGPNHDHLLNPDSAMTSSAPSRASAMHDNSASPALVNSSGSSQPQP